MWATYKVKHNNDIKLKQNMQKLHNFYKTKMQPFLFLKIIQLKNKVNSNDTNKSKWQRETVSKVILKHIKQTGTQYNIGI